MSEKITAAENAIGSSAEGRGATILIVEDSPVQAELLRQALEGAGYKIIAASNGAEGLGMAKANRPDVVVSDINMPLMDGYAMCHAIRREQALKTTPVILLTMLSDPLDVIRGLEAGADAYVTKPYNVPSLVSRIKSLLTDPPPPPPETERRRIKILLAGETHMVDAHGPRILNLLISTYENAVLQNRELDATQKALEDMNQHLEQKVEEKTAALRESEEKFHSIAASAQDAIVIIDNEGRIVFWNSAAEKIFGHSGEDAVGRELHALLAPVRYHDDYRKGFDRFTSTGEGPVVGKTLDLAALRKGGEEFPIELSLSAVKLGGEWHAIGIIRDITERKRVEAAIVASETRYRGLFEAARDGILILDVQNGHIVDVNPFMIELLGYTREQYLGKKLWEIGPFKDTAATKTAFAELQKKKFVHYENLPLRTEDGRDIDVEFVSHAYRTNGGEVIQCNIRDITERKLAEEELKKINWALRALSKGNSALVHARDEDELFQLCCEAIVSGDNYALAWIGIARDDPDRTIEILASAGKAIGFMKGFEVSWGDALLGHGPSGTAIKTGATQVNNDFAANPAFAPWLEQARANLLASAISLPIRSDGAMVGVLTVYGHEQNAFGEDEVALFEQLAGDIGYGIDNRRTQLAYEEGILQRQRDAEKLHATFESAIAALATTVEQRDPYTAGHQRRVASLAVAIGREFGLDEQHIEGLRIVGIIHDIGKISVPAEILSRPGKLSEVEFAIIKGHAQAGYEIVKGVDFPWPVAQTILQHHERLDGSGYPQGLKGEQIIFEARILAVADMVEAMSSHRPYRPGLGIDAALAQLHKEAGTTLAPDVVAACERLFREERFRLPD